MRLKSFLKLKGIVNDKTKKIKFDVATRQVVYLFQKEKEASLYFRLINLWTVCSL